MAALADKIRENHEQAAATQQALRNGRRVTRRVPDQSDPEYEGVADAPITLDKATAVIEKPLPVTATTAAAHTAITASPLDLPAEQFRSGLERRKENRRLLMTWLREALVDGIDFGRIHITSRDRCQFARAGRAKECPDSAHWSKPSLFKPGAEKITGMLGMTVHYPSLPAYEQAALSKNDISLILLRCELHDAQGRVVAEGVGARSLSQDYGDVNKSLKMAEKSAHIDATLRLAGLSEVFTQDLEDRPPMVEIGTAESSPGVQNQGKGKAHDESQGRTAATASPTRPEAAIGPVSRERLASLREHIYRYGFTEQRVTAWLMKSSQGALTQLEQLTMPQCQSLLEKLDQWADAEMSLQQAGNWN